MWRREIEDRHGFSLVEVMIVSMLAGMLLLAAFPLVKTGWNVVKQEQKEMEAMLFGDHIFERIRMELQSVETADRELDEWIENVCEEENIYANSNFQDYEFDVVLEAEILEDEWGLLGVNLMEDGVCVYEREEVVPLINLGIR